MGWAGAPERANAESHLQELSAFLVSLPSGRATPGRPQRPAGPRGPRRDRVSDEDQGSHALLPPLERDSLAAMGAGVPRWTCCVPQRTDDARGRGACTLRVRSAARVWLSVEPFGVTTVRSRKRCRGGESGKRCGLTRHWAKALAGSTPVPGTAADAHTCAASVAERILGSRVRPQRRRFVPRQTKGRVRLPGPLSFADVRGVSNRIAAARRLMRQGLRVSSPRATPPPRPR